MKDCQPHPEKCKDEKCVQRKSYTACSKGKVISVWQFDRFCSLWWCSLPTGMFFLRGSLPHVDVPNGHVPQSNQIYLVTFMCLTVDASSFLQRYRISANSFRGNYSFLEGGVRKLFKGGNYSREETIVFLLF